LGRIPKNELFIKKKSVPTYASLKTVIKYLSQTPINL